MNIEQIARSAKQAAIELAAVPTQVKNRALMEIAENLATQADRIVSFTMLSPIASRCRFPPSVRTRRVR